MKDETSYDMETMTTITALMVGRAMTRVVEVVGEGDRCDGWFIYDSDFCMRWHVLFAVAACFCNGYF